MSLLNFVKDMWMNLNNLERKNTLIRKKKQIFFLNKIPVAFKTVCNVSNSPTANETAWIFKIFKQNKIVTKKKNKIVNSCLWSIFFVLK